jgi:SSS family solute:Na+ symporter
MINAPLFAVIFLGMFWKRTTGHAAFTGLLAGFLIALFHHGITYPAGADTLVKGGWIAHLHSYPVEMAQNFWTAIYACTTSAVVTVVLSFLTRRNKTDDELKGLVYSLTPRHVETHLPWYRRSSTLAIFVLAVATVLTILFW